MSSHKALTATAPLLLLVYAATSAGQEMPTAAPDAHRPAEARGDASER